MEADPFGIVRVSETHGHCADPEGTMLHADKLPNHLRSVATRSTAGTSSATNMQDAAAASVPGGKRADGTTIDPRSLNFVLPRVQTSTDEPPFLASVVVIADPEDAVSTSTRCLPLVWVCISIQQRFKHGQLTSITTTTTTTASGSNSSIERRESCRVCRCLVYIHG